jgi:hypothetical protein
MWMCYYASGYNKIMPRATSSGRHRGEDQVRIDAVVFNDAESSPMVGIVQVSQELIDDRKQQSYGK